MAKRVLEQDGRPDVHGRDARPVDDMFGQKVQTLLPGFLSAGRGHLRNGHLRHVDQHFEALALRSGYTHHRSGLQIIR
jgi:hypothetical protein